MNIADLFRNKEGGDSSIKICERFEVDKLQHKGKDGELTLRPQVVHSAKHRTNQGGAIHKPAPLVYRRLLCLYLCCQLVHLPEYLLK
jgi:hypothetical protein